MGTRMTGKVKWFNDTKGYGFIEVVGRKKNVFVHYSGIAGTGRRTLADGANVEFDFADDERGGKAENVTVV